VDAEGPQYYQLITIKHSIQSAAVAITASHQPKQIHQKGTWCFDEKLLNVIKGLKVRRETV